MLEDFSTNPRPHTLSTMCFPCAIAFYYYTYRNTELKNYAKYLYLPIFLILFQFETNGNIFMSVQTLYFLRPPPPHKKSFLSAKNPHENIKNQAKTLKVLLTYLLRNLIT